MKRVRADDGRTWTVQSRISWTKPDMTDQFEHDMAAGYVSCVAMLGITVLLTLFVVFWTPPGVVIPAWFLLLILLVVLLAPVLWAMQRPWIITAHTAETIDAEGQGERWEGVVNGIFPALEHTRHVAEELRERNVPNSEVGPMSRLGH